ncbi:eukaryotic translation initiation factor 4E nuclear import factor 1 S homeolog isoform X2 [Xenopus laevis]|uniref:Eukaryotic translation initiation factor 4E nuclear import factor 1 S homeolog isoform X2 n=1 Tax=Xenopus laevis TaxID=8355 RepID=A0A8J0TXW3_XENLA|nr:eukaryotic translation initiation factor 4E nuclear import factor 1 S homeolog isoform X2 [Xenopus laevis]
MLGCIPLHISTWASSYVAGVLWLPGLFSMDYREETDRSDPFGDIRKPPRGRSHHSYSKEELLDIKELPHSKERPSCLLDKYDSDGVWDPEKWHSSLYPNSGRSSPVEALKKDCDTERNMLKRRIADPRERVKEDDLDVVLSPQRRSFGGGCHVTAAANSRRSGSPLDNKENESMRMLGSRRIGSGRLMTARGFDRDVRGGEKDREPREGRDREKEYKDKRFRREYGDGKRIFGERRRNDSCTEEEPEWFSAGPTSQSETIELIGFDDKILEEDQKGRKRTRKRTTSLKEGVECNGGVLEEVALPPAHAADQEVPEEAVLPEPAPGEFDFNEFFNLDKSVPGLASMIEDVLGEGSVSASRFSRWFSNHSHSGSRSSSLRSTPHEELERLAGLEQVIPSLGQNSGNYFAPIQFEERADKVDILEILHKAKVDLKPLLSSLTANKEKLRESTHSGVVLSVEEVEAGFKGLKVEQEGKVATPYMADQLEEALIAMAGPRKIRKDGDMSAFNKLVSSMKASGTLPSQPKVNRNQESAVLSSDVATTPLQRNILQELLGQPVSDSSSHVLSNLMGSLDSSLLQQRSPSPQIPQVFPTRASSADYLRNHIPSPIGFASGPSKFLGEQFPGGIPREDGPMIAQVSPLELQQAALDGFIPHEIALQAANYYHPGYGKVQMDKGRENFRSRQQPRVNKSPVANMRGVSLSPGPGASVTSMLSPSFTPTSVIRKMYESKEKIKDEPTEKQNVSGKEGGQGTLEDGSLPNSIMQDSPQDTSLVMGNKVSVSRHTSCTPPLPHQSRYTKDQDYRPKSTGRRTPTVSSPVPGASFLQPLHQLPIVPVVRPSHQLHPGLVQRMLAQGVPPQRLSLLQAGLLPPGIDLPPLHALSPSVLGQPFYPLSPAGHPLLNQRPANPLQLAMMQQSMQRSGSGLHAPPLGMTNRPNMYMEQRASQRSSSPVGLAKWFGSDVLQQPLPSMPAKVISVDELEYRQ